jgi:hypothetical protein
VILPLRTPSRRRLVKSMGEGYAGEWRRWYARNGLTLLCYGMGEEGRRNLARGWENRTFVLRTQ